MHPYHYEHLTQQRHEGFLAEAEAHRQARAVAADTPKRRWAWRRRTTPVAVTPPEGAVTVVPAV